MCADGFLNLLKPPGMTSHDASSFVRALLRGRRTGHLGTLDPAAAGVLPIAVGRATRLFSLASGSDKAYRAEITFGLTTDTMDADGELTSRQDSSRLTADAVRALLPGFTGEVEQVPPAFSAVQVGGRRMHELARRGVDVQAPPRRVRILSLGLVDFLPGPAARAVLDVVCTAGTYVRVLASDLGRVTGCGACLTFLVRTRAGPFELSDAITMQECEAAAERGDLVGALLPMDWPLGHLPALALDAPRALRFVQGTRVAVEAGLASRARVYGPDDHFLGLGELVQPGQLAPRLVLAAREEAEP